MSGRGPDDLSGQRDRGDVRRIGEDTVPIGVLGTEVGRGGTIGGTGGALPHGGNPAAVGQSEHGGCALVKEQVQSVDAVFRCKGDVQGGEPQFGEAEGYAVEGYVRSDGCGQGGALV